MDAINQDPSDLDGIPRDSLDRKTTPIDFIIVGSGPGGAPLACRLAEAGMNVLVLEAGVDPGKSPSEKPCKPCVKAEKDVVVQQGSEAAATRTAENDHLTYFCPGLHAAATEPHEYPNSKAVCTSWGFWAKHYSDSNSKPVFYPRASALGGCSAHHAMISIYGSDHDWQAIADKTGDASWAPGKMRMIYQQIEHLRYGDSPTLVGR